MAKPTGDAYFEPAPVIALAGSSPAKGEGVVRRGASVCKMIAEDLGPSYMPCETNGRGY
jgi:hypothetical protein